MHINSKNSTNLKTNNLDRQKNFYFKAFNVKHFSLEAFTSFFKILFMQISLLTKQVHSCYSVFKFCAIYSLLDEFVDKISEIRLFNIIITVLPPFSILKTYNASFI